MNRACRGILVLILLHTCGGSVFAQLSGSNQQLGSYNKPQKDTSKTNTNQWKDESVNITYKRLSSERSFIPDTGVHAFHRVPFTQPWNRDLGNTGSPTKSMLFGTDSRPGPSLGYHIFDAYRFDIDSAKYYTTSRPYSSFGYQLGSKLEQIASIMHTQNVKPNWNVAAEYRKINSQGFYNIQRANHDNLCLSTNYKSLDKHYTLHAALVYNKEQQDENGGILNDSFLANQGYSDRKTIQVAYQNSYSSKRSSVTNTLRDCVVQLQHGYTWGPTDTTYGEDTGSYNYSIKPVFSITHKLEAGTMKHTYNDLTADSLRYLTLFNQSFLNNGTGSYTAGEDSVLVKQKWAWIDNNIMLNGFTGKEGKQLKFSVGIGNRLDQFISQPTANLNRDSLPKLVYNVGYERNTLMSNYINGEIKKEALQDSGWEYGASAKLYFTGPCAGNFLFNALIGKEIHPINGLFTAGIQQQLSNAPYAYTYYSNAYIKRSFPMDKESVTNLYATIESRKIKLAAGIRNYVISNYIYIDQNEVPNQYKVPFDLMQLWLRKVFRLKHFVLDNELVYQQIPNAAPVNIPSLLGRHQLAFENGVFHGKLILATGIEVRYTSAYNIAGYDALLNRFYYQDTIKKSNVPEASVFVNFRIKRFRAFVSGDFLQQLILKQNTILAIGTPMEQMGGNIPMYPGQDFTFRFGFLWPLVN